MKTIFRFALVLLILVVNANESTGQAWKPKLLKQVDEVRWISNVKNHRVKDGATVQSSRVGTSAHAGNEV